MKECILSFLSDETGAVTVDWVVLTAAIVGIAIAVLTVVAGGIGDASSDINDDLGSAITLATLISGDGGGGYVPTTQGVFDSGYNVQGSATTPEDNYAILYSGYVDNPNEVTLDLLAGAEQQLIDSGGSIPEGNSTAVQLQNPT